MTYYNLTKLASEKEQEENAKAALQTAVAGGIIGGGASLAGTGVKYRKKANKLMDNIQILKRYDPNDPLIEQGLQVVKHYRKQGLGFMGAGTLIGGAGAYHGYNQLKKIHKDNKTH